MLFNSLQFLIFFTVLFFSYFAIPARFRNCLLLAASCYFYMVYVPAYILILLFLIATDFFLGLRIARTEGKKRKQLLLISIAANLGTLFLFKYFNFFNENIAALAQLIHWNYSPLLLRIALPLGLSFHVFQSLSYVIEVYKGKFEPEKNFVTYALYVLFFSQLVAGPIERPQHFLPQLNRSPGFDATRVRRGFEIMLIGFFKKLVIADRLALIVNSVFGAAHEPNGFVYLIAAVAFSYQLYCDFSGYSDIAVGSALVFGYELTNNFNRPFSARSVAEFWRRWHISLSSWLRDYLYNPLVFAGKHITKTRIYASLFITFVLIGLWHGANWTYIVFGAMHGAYLVISSVTERMRKRISDLTRLSRFPHLRHAWQSAVVFVLATLSFVVFRSASLSQAWGVFAAITHAPSGFFTFLSDWRAIMTTERIGLSAISTLIVIFFIVVLEGIQYLQERKHSPYVAEGRSRPVRWAYYYFLVFAVLYFGYFGSQAFIYFKF